MRRLVEVMRRLLAPDGCAWDRAQTPASLRQYVIEEAHEVVEAIDSGDPAALREELGDLLMQVVFLAELGERQGQFTLDEVVEGIAAKLERRHPHVFGAAAQGASDPTVSSGWHEAKRREKAGRGTLDGVPASLPALLAAVRVGEKAAVVGFDWPDAAGPRAKVDEELAELDAAHRAGDLPAIEHELGDVLFAVASLARKVGIDPEAALRSTLARFRARFVHAEAAAAARGAALADLDVASLDELWQAAKRATRAE